MAPAEPGRYWNWYILAHVCRRWRQFLLSSPVYLGLQLLINRDSPVSDVLLHSPSLPLSIYYERDKDEQNGDDHELLPESLGDLGGVELALEQADRVQDIAILSNAEELLKFFSKMTKPAPLLETLRIESQDSRVTLPDDFLGGVAPSLRSIKIANVTPYFLSTSGLSHLDISFRGVDVNSSLQNSLLESVSSLHQLRSLVLGLWSFTEGIQAPPIQALTELSMLSEFRFLGLSPQFEAVLRRINAPALAKLNASFSDLTTITVPSLLRFVQNSPKLLNLGAIYVELSPDGGGIITCPSTLDDARIVLYSTPSEPRRTDVVNSSIAIACQLLSPVLSSANTLVVRRHWVPRPSLVSARARWIIRGVEWHAMLGAFSGASSVHVESALIPSFVSVLQESSGYGLLPNLKEFYLLFYSNDGQNPSNVLVKLEPFLNAHNTPEPVLKVLCTIIPHYREHSVLKHGRSGPKIHTL
ncbi:hypothetical protein BC834DRAFT_969927 [Gloeopeniophorella convolvens]|nr:hypothetical protein BC834DRAFT_969927 [Gloeopeniophorella convolvens]